MNIYEKEFIIEDFLCREGELTLKNIINYFIETTNHHSNFVGLANEDLMTKDYTWMIYKWRIKVLKYPKAFQRIKVRTWASGFKSLKAFREFEIYLGDEKIAYASSIFLLIDLESRKPVKIGDKISEIYKINDLKFFDKIERINEPIDREPINNFDYIILRRDIDLNNHVNNSVYAELLCEAMPKYLYKKKFSDININYTKELLLGDHIFIDVYLKDDKLYFFFKNREKKEIYARATLRYISWKKFFQMVTLFIENL